MYSRYHQVVVNPWHGIIPAGQDLQELIDIMDRLKVPQEKRPKICPKIEKPQADFPHNIVLRCGIPMMDGGSCFRCLKLLEYVQM